MSARRPRSRLRRNIRIAQLELLAAMEHAPTLSAAARATNVTQPAASRLLRSLSANLKVELFERVGRNLRPTPAGRALLDRAARIMADIDRIEDEVEAINRGLVGTVSVGAGTASCYVLIPRAIELLVSTAPRIRVNLREGPMDELAARLRNGDIDVLIGRLGESAEGDEIATEDLYAPAMAIVCSPHHPLAGQAGLTWKEAFQQRWILPEPGTPMRAGIEALFRRHRQRPRECLVESSSIAANIGLMRSHHLFWVLSVDIASYFEALGTLRLTRLPYTRGPSPFVMAYSSDRALSSAAQQFVRCLRDAAQMPNVPVPASRKRGRERG